MGREVVKVRVVRVIDVMRNWIAKVVQSLVQAGLLELMVLPKNFLEDFLALHQ